LLDLVGHERLFNITLRALDIDSSKGITFHGTDAYTHMHIYTPGSNNKTTFI
jgi:hypothetical protein